jgi:hypothetical protein
MSTCLHPGQPPGISGNVSQPEQPERPTGTPSFFHAYQAQSAPRSLRRYVLSGAVVVLALTGLGRWFVSYRSEATPFRLDTPWGLRTVQKGMSPQEVSGLLGQPVGKEVVGGRECIQYGRPTLRAPTFVLHTVCYEDGKLLEVSQKRYNSWVVLPDGAIAPIVYDDEESQAPAPPAEGAPGLAGKTSP